MCVCSLVRTPCNIDVPPGALADCRSGRCRLCLCLWLRLLFFPRGVMRAWIDLGVVSVCPVEGGGEGVSCRALDPVGSFLSHVGASRAVCMCPSVVSIGVGCSLLSYTQHAHVYVQICIPVCTKSVGCVLWVKKLVFVDVDGARGASLRDSVPMGAATCICSVSRRRVCVICTWFFGLSFVVPSGGLYTRRMERVVGEVRRGQNPTA